MACNMNWDYITASNNVSRLPTRVLCLIFDLISTKDDFVDIPASGMGMICQSWRAIAVTYPKLWVHITLPFHGTDLTAAERDRKIESLDLFLHNFPHISTELTLIPRSFSLRLDPEDKIIHGFSGRWTRICLERFTLVDKITQPLPCLKSLSCHLPLTYHHSSSLPSAPQLKHLELAITEPVSFRPQDMDIPYNQITTLYLLETAWRNLTEALQHFVNLQNFSFSLTRPAEWHATPLPKVTLQLKSFALIIQTPGIRADYVVALLESLTLPVATRITLAKKTFGRSGPWRGDIVHKFLSGSAETLTKLDLVGVPLKDDILHQCLSATPRVQELTFGEVKEPMRSASGKGAGSQLLTALGVSDSITYSSIDKIILPELKSLTLEGMISFYEASKLVAVVRSRSEINDSKPVTRLLNLALRCSNISSEWLACIKTELPQRVEVTIEAPLFLH